MNKKLTILSGVIGLILILLYINYSKRVSEVSLGIITDSYKCEQLKMMSMMLPDDKVSRMADKMAQEVVDKYYQEQDVYSQWMTKMALSTAFQNKCAI